MWIPPNIIHPVIERAHTNETAAHGGVAKTLERLRRFFYWPKMPMQLKSFIKNCQTYKDIKPSQQNLRPEIGNQVIIDRPFQNLYLGFIGKYPRSKRGNWYAFIILDHFTKYTFIKAMREAATGNVIEL